MNVLAVLAWHVVLVGAVGQATDHEPLHALIDQHLQPAWSTEAERCSDAEFLRRLSLDLVGMPPTADEARAFLADPAPDKRQRLVDRLLASPHYARHLAAALDLMLMERRANTHVTADEWQAWLLKSVQENKPWNVLVREILLAGGDDPALRPAARFALDRGADAHALTRDIGRIFFGRDMQCAQCHDSPIIEDYLQSDYHGLLAFLEPGYPVVRTEGEKQVTVYAEKAGTDLKFESVFVGTPRLTGPRIPGDVALEEPFFLPGEEYQVAPAENVKSVPKFSRRAKLAELATNGSNQPFNRNIANRLWAHMFGRGLVHPLDLHHPNNPAADPELLQLLADRFATMNFDIKAFLREIALSDVYQRSFDLPADLLPVSAQAATRITQLDEQRAALEQKATASNIAYLTALEAWQQAEGAYLPVAGELEAARTQYGEAKKKMDEAAKAVTDATAQLQARQSAATTVQQAASAAEKAAAALPEDKELADAAQKFVSRSAQLAAEVATLTKAVEEKTAALQGPTAALNDVKTTVESALAKATPLKAAMKQAEEIALAARRQSGVDARSLATLEVRLETARQSAQLPALHEAVAAARQMVAAREAELAAANGQVNDHAAVMVQHEAGVQTATEGLTAATGALNAARAAYAARTETVQAISAAFTAADVARQKVPEDAVLIEVAAKLQERASVAQTATGEDQQQVDAAVAAEQTAAAALAAAQKSLAEATAERARREQAARVASEALAAAGAEVSARQAELDTAVSGLADRWARDFTVAALKPLTPEQLCWSVLRVTGVYDRYWQAQVAELDKASPLTDQQKQDAAQLAARTRELEQRTFDQLKGNVGTFITFYGAAAGQPQGDFFSTADQALFAANGGVLNSWVAPAGDNITERIVKQSDARAAAEELYLGVLTRMPTEEETAEVTAYLAHRPDDKSAAAQELVWGLLNSAEFRFNH